MYELWLVEMDGSLRERLEFSWSLTVLQDLVKFLKLHPAEYTIKVV